MDQYVPPTREEQIVIAHLDGSFSAQRMDNPIPACSRAATDDESSDYWDWLDSLEG